MAVSRVLGRCLLISALLFPLSGWSAEFDDINQLAEQGHTAQALERLNSYLGKQPKDAKALFLKGVLLAESEKQDDAIKVFKELTEQYPQLPAPYNNLAVLYAYQGNYDKAQAALEAAIRTHPSYATAHENLGDIYARMASESYSRALQLDTSNSRAQSKLSLIKDLLPSPGQAASNVALAEPSPPAKVAAATPAVTTPKATPTKPVETEKPAVELPASKPATPTAPTVSASKPAEAQNVKPTEPSAPVAKPAEPPKTVAAGSEQAIRDAVDTWAKAWAGKNVTQYLASYAKDFKTPNGEPRSSWEATRKDRLNKPAKIELKLSNVQVSMDNAHTATVRFQQFYQAGRLTQRTGKRLVLVQQQGRWLIQQETNR
ncbi:Tetratricopeptide repeat-containing protein [Methylobacillus rhizosphaerae]|uniref:Tetratricopeptide repeat-containing protein n=1 Tax=Methylobacillus rhizosphaerae TaxID=551994 RepID=A0A238ZZA5_9PROT|nr:tetratricopeptide repeat protein [Methylobacillus rhizosphaerae]SNR88188.1 Tetratricopeptide repeat-containing protein [Methylobacillus rhizosphaerae]